ncbi:RNA polymerase sigma factor [Streptomyces europaeiscabiei]|uniref:RNA polymerase sigma factor n=1 Tax=Streptomyces europaeiscabiei TaxID=146819 RepID=UPI0029B50163|nr:sigma-70 family RNA polymerase sigma factor [Streptomyces europaeiscabiei]MDX3582278.1 sigma-70 family RNA polymerase sigma factor [Streptomyces europaeiscabiei]
MHSLADVAVDTGRIRAVLALGGVPLDALDDGMQQVRLKPLEEQANPAAAKIRNPSAWVAVVASRVAADWHRARKRDAGLRERPAERWSRRPPTDHPEEDRVLALTVSEGLEALPTAQRQVLALRYYADLTVRDIALQLDIPEGMVKSRLHAAISAMRTRLNEMEVI